MEGKFKSAWVDSFHRGTGIFLEWQNNDLIITAYNITPQGDEAKATKTLYNRVNNTKKFLQQKPQEFINNFSNLLFSFFVIGYEY